VDSRGRTIFLLAHIAGTGIGSLRTPMKS